MGQRGQAQRGEFPLRDLARTYLYGRIAIGVVATLMAVSCSSYADMLRPPIAGRDVPTCSFDVGDTVTRGGVGAVVPERGSGVSGFADKVNGRSSSIEIDVAPDGVVTITWSKNGVESAPKSCVLP
jgi:hypothetical protein